jgi:hypothetical protein
VHSWLEGTESIMHHTIGMVGGHGAVPDLDKTWDETLVTFFNFGVTRLFLDAKRSLFVFLVQS